MTHPNRCCVCVCVCVALSLALSLYLCLSDCQDDYSLNRKVVVRLIESEKKGRLKNARLLEADDGASAVDTLRRELSEGRQVDFVLMDYVMVSEAIHTYVLMKREYYLIHPTRNTVHISYLIAS